MEKKVIIDIEEYEEIIEDLKYFKEKIREFENAFCDKKTVKVLIDFGLGGNCYDLELLNFEKNMKQSEVEDIIDNKFRMMKIDAIENHRLRQRIKNLKNRGLIDRIMNNEPRGDN